MQTETRHNRIHSQTICNLQTCVVQKGDFSLIFSLSYGSLYYYSLHTQIGNVEDVVYFIFRGV